jgi:hypothetical protein
MGLLAGACAATACSSTSRNPEKPCASMRWPTRTSRSGTRRCSATTARRSSSPTSGAAAPRRTARPAPAGDGRQHHARHRRRQEVHAARVLQDPDGAERAGELRVAQRLADPVPGRDIMVQGWYQGGVDVIDFTDADKPFEIAFFDRGPVDAPPRGRGERRRRAARSPARGARTGTTAYIYSSEMARGLDILELVPSEHLSPTRSPRRSS